MYQDKLEIQRQIEEKKEQLAKLKPWVKMENDGWTRATGADTHYGSEAAALEHQISQLERQLQNIVRNQEDYMRVVEQRESYESMMRNQMAFERNNAFQQIKSQYEKTSPFKRVVAKLSGKAPKWDKIRNLSTEQLEFLASIQRGESLPFGVSNSVARAKTEKDKDKIIYDYFMNLLKKDPAALEIEMQARNMQQGRTM